MNGRHPALCGLLIGLLVGPLKAEQPPGEPILGQAAGWALEEPAASLLAVESGTELRAEPVPGAPVLAVLPEAQLTLLEWRQTWARVRFGEQVGWVDIDQAPSASELPRPAEPRILALEVDPSRLQGARAQLGEPQIEGRLGPWRLYSDVAKPALLERLDHLAGQVEGLFVDRYALLPIEAEERGAVVLYARQHDYLAFKQPERWVDRGTSGHAVPGLAVIHAENDQRDQLAAVLIHELTHLLTWQTFGRDLPWWLEEGLAEDLALSQVRAGQLQPVPLDHDNLRYGRTLGIAFTEVRRGLASGLLPSIEELLESEHGPDVESADAQLHYALAAFWVRFLLHDAERATGFRAFLAAVASGEAPDLKTLEAHLARPLGETVIAFRGWLKDCEEEVTRRSVRRR